MVANRPSVDVGYPSNRSNKDILAKGDSNSDSSANLSPSQPLSPRLMSTLSDSLPAVSPNSKRRDKDKSDKEKGISKTVSTFFKTLFTTKPDSNEAEDAVSKSLSSPNVASSGRSFTVERSQVSRSKASFVSNTKPGTAMQQVTEDIIPTSSVALGKSFSSKSVAIPSAPQSPLTRPSRATSVKQEMKPSTTILALSPSLPANMARSVWCLKDYAIVEKMYTGYASTVYKAWCKSSGETVCLKAYNMGNLCELNRYQIYREVKLHSSLQHENIIKLFAAFQEADQVVLVQEFADSGDLFLLLHRYGGKLPEKTAVEMILHPFLKVLTYLHQNCVVHRDIKPENVLFTRSMQLKICDFGLAIDLREERAVTRAGTLEYMAPEVLDCPFKNKPEENKEREDLYYSLTVDSWAMGVLTYELLVGFPPFNDKQRAAIEEKIRSEQPRFPSSMSEGARTFVLRSLQKDPIERPTATELLHHSWIQAHRRGGQSSGSSSVRRVGAGSGSGNISLRSGAPPLSPSAPRPNAALSSPRPPLNSVHSSPFENSPSTRSPLPPPVPEEEVECFADSPVPSAGFDKILSKPSMEMRTLEGDLIRAMPSYLSFTQGTVKQHPPAKDKVKLPPVGTSGMSFNTSANPKLQQFRAQYGGG
ncbi:hypothetical protein CEUSTIGMA_g2349.t1 [Chlamydomonas eustigma]|uniref:Protein kinase domain-containing protein n=1 Tax=Chlamydomonas eustigma TaxID=1157962 RepID=A0A250WVN0_9CHLO|nr:hypothetical protein CEUSTIGMA_g2349.t1 [Chlamydomonas eustigma]|eukprot:GAX74903.1 hypothetical protein CEUSTIGMA_g2349.t1 [Chlamydomonas eustigma]